MSLDWLVLGASLLSGLLGGAHCAAMCGGIATALSVQQRGGWWVALQPNLGRVAGYVIAGAIVGGMGHGLLEWANVPALGLALRATVGAILILAALRLLDRSGRLRFLGAPAGTVWNWMRPLQRHLVPANTMGKRVASGVLWGWLPCGLSTTLLAVAWLQASALHGAMTMLAFGIGTLPVMLPLTWAGARLGQHLYRGHWRTAAGSLVLVSGMLTLSAPWWLHAPTVHAWLVAMGCRSLS